MQLISTEPLKPAFKHNKYEAANHNNKNDNNNKNKNNSKNNKNNNGNNNSQNYCSLETVCWENFRHSAVLGFGSMPRYHALQSEAGVIGPQTGTPHRDSARITYRLYGV